MHSIAAVFYKPIQDNIHEFVHAGLISLKNAEIIIDHLNTVGENITMPKMKKFVADGMLTEANSFKILDRLTK